MSDPAQIACPDDILLGLVERLSGDGESGAKELSKLLRSYPNDARLHFLDGSLLAGAQDYDAAQMAMRRAVELSPDYGLARYQLGFLLLSRGEAHAAQEAWGPLHGLPSDHFLRLFADGLTHLIHDRFEDAIIRLEEGIAANDLVEPMNNDIRLIIAEAKVKLAEGVQGETVTSSAHLLLQQAALKSTRH
jgi:tetratricopeptide (TPR) repeat protein